MCTTDEDDKLRRRRLAAVAVVKELGAPDEQIEPIVNFWYNFSILMSSEKPEDHRPERRVVYIVI